MWLSRGRLRQFPGAHYVDGSDNSSPAVVVAAIAAYAVVEMATRTAEDIHAAVD
jgi:hypothetical protein